MPSPSDRPDDRIQELEERWEADPSSRIFVQLADEYRRQGRLADAIQVLEKGLERQPNYLSAQVALGRCRLADGDAQGAVELLEPAVAQDPTHMVANKLLVEAYIETGRREPARERLDLYGLMNDGDPDIETLRRRIETASPKASPAPAGEMPAETPVEQPSERPVEVSTGVPASEGTAPPVLAGPAGDPFGELWSPDRLRAWAAGFEAEGLFSLPPELAPPPPSKTPPPADFLLRSEPVPTAADEPFLEAAPLEPFPLEISRAEPETEPAPPAPTARAPVGEERAATVTLGQLYMAQGHDEEAARIFRAVLERDSENRVCREALEILEARNRPPSASEPEAPPEEDTSWPALEEDAEELATAALAEGVGRGLTGRRIAVLKGYLERLRGGVEHDVP